MLLPSGACFVRDDVECQDCPFYTTEKDPRVQLWETYYTALMYCCASVTRERFNTDKKFYNTQDFDYLYHGHTKFYRYRREMMERYGGSRY